MLVNGSPFTVHRSQFAVARWPIISPSVTYVPFIERRTANGERRTVNGKPLTVALESIMERYLVEAIDPDTEIIDQAIF